MAIKQNAVDNFLASLGSLTKDQALANLALDARSYKWNAETIAAIKAGIEVHFAAAVAKLDAPAKTHDERIALLAIAEQFRSLSGFVNRLAESTNRNECVYGSIVKKALPEAFAALSELQAQFGDVNGGTQPRFDNEQMAETAVAAGGVLRLKTINRLCSLAPDDDGEEFVPMTEAELAAMNARFAANPETSF